MDASSLRFPTPPPISPSAQPALGVGLALNMLLFAGIHLGMSFGISTKATDQLTLDLMQAAPVIYLVLLLPICAAYGLAAAAWTGWSWWRVPFATLAGATLGLGVNAWAMATWIARKGWVVNPLLSSADPRVQHLLGLAFLSLLVLALVAASMWPRWFRQVPGS